KPEVLTKDIGDVQHEPCEELVLDVPEENAGTCIERLCLRKGELQHMTSQNGRTVLEFKIPSRGLLGFRSDFIRLTRGQGIMTASFHFYIPGAGDMGTSRNGVIISIDLGEATAYALKNLEDRGMFFITPKTTVYKGMIVGENNRQQDIVVN